MKTKFFLLSTIISSCAFTFVYGQPADYNTVPIPPKRSCYSSSMCTGGPNVIGENGNHMPSSNGSEGTKVLQTSSTEQFVGTIKSVNRVTLPNQIQIQLILSTDQGDMLVIVGPASYVDQAKVKLQAGDKVTVKGYRITANGNQVILAAEIQKNGYTLPLLNQNRQPLWGTQSPSQPGMPFMQQYSGSQSPWMPNSRY